MLLSVSILICLSVCAPAAIVIDDFSTTQVIPKSSANCVTGSDMIGGQRDVGVSSDSSADINTTVPGHLYFRSGNTSYGSVGLVYDGIDDSYSNDSYGGLGHLDLTNGGTYNGFVFHFTQMPSSYNFFGIWVKLQQQGDKQGYASTLITNKQQDVLMAFDKFVVDPPASAPPPVGFALDSMPTLIDFTNVGYIRIEFALYGSDDTFALDSITTGYVAPEPATLLLFGLGGLSLRYARGQALRKK
jgi:hypothetical protein